VSNPAEPATGVGQVEPRLQAEFPGLELRWCRLAARPGRSGPILRRRLRGLSDRYAGARVVAMRTQPIAHAYRAFYRQVGLDPDTTRVPSEEAAVGRLLHGGFRSRDRISDARLVALVETGVPVWALDAAAVQVESLHVRTSGPGDALGRGEAGLALAEGRLVVADARDVHALLFGEPAVTSRPGSRTETLVLYSVAVDGVPTIYLEEALWLCGDLLGSED
jgi:DNA/RNA-binding domain of Phe-tRNA-synthetase-like protein